MLACNIPAAKTKKTNAYKLHLNIIQALQRLRLIKTAVCFVVLKMDIIKKYGISIDESIESKLLFFKFPKKLIDDPTYKNLSSDAKILYMAFLYRAFASVESIDFVDDDNFAYIYFTIDEMMETVPRKKSKILKLLNELEVYGLIYRERRGQGRANRIYVLKGKLFND